MSYNWLDWVEQTESYKPIKPRKLDFWTFKFWFIFYLVYAAGAYLSTRLGYMWIVPLAILALSMLFVVKNWKLIDSVPSFAPDRIVVAILFLIFGIWNIYTLQNKWKPVLTMPFEKSYKVVSWATSFPINFKTKNADFVLINWKKYSLDWDTSVDIPLTSNQVKIEYVLWNEKTLTSTWTINLTK